MAEDRTRGRNTRAIPKSNWGKFPTHGHTEVLA